MKAAPKKRRPRAPIPFPRPVPAEPDQPPAAAPVSPLLARAHEWALEPIVFRCVTTGEERVIDPAAWPRYGLERITLSPVPFRVTITGVATKAARLFRLMLRDFYRSVAW